ncbi:helix-turn-helix domain-containing protein [Phenylobacterium sp.]|uniref:IclR family transcriptional regulator n=1 Tax=Phenylobacterium sp. TaxID=1871053 RepID=UPI00301C2498
MASSVLGGEISSIGPWTSDTSTTKARTVKSAERTLALFELFSLYQRPMVVGEIAKALQIPQPSVSMLVRNLTSLGYLEHDRAARTYVPTIRIMLLGSWIHRRFSEESNLERRIDALSRGLGETVMMGIQNGVFCQYVLVQMPENPDLAVQSGLLRPITCTAIGRALLSLKSDAEIETIVRRCNAEVSDERLRVKPSQFMETIVRIRAQGYARTAGDMTPNRSVIAVSIPGPLGKMPMAIGVGGLVDNIDAKEDAILEALRDFKAASEGRDAPAR